MRNFNRFRSGIKPRTILLFAALSLSVALLRSLVNLPGGLSVDEQTFSLGTSLPLYSLFAIIERVLTVGIIFLFVRWLISYKGHSGFVYITGIILAIPLFIQLARISDGSSALLLLAIVLRHWFSIRFIALFVIAILGLTAWLSSLPVGEWSIFGLSFTVTDSSSLDQILTSGFIAASYLGFALFSLELALKLAKEQEDLRQALVKLESARDQERRLLALEERTALSRELHDTIGHHMTALNLYAQRAEILAQQGETPRQLIDSLAQIRTQGLQVIQGLTQVVSTLRSEEKIAQHSLFTQITALCQKWPAPILLTTTGEDCALPEDLMLTAYRTCQEALTNASKHAPEQEIKLQVTLLPNSLKIEASNPLVAPVENKTVHSNGLHSSGYGLRGLRERAKLQGGTLESKEDQGVFKLCLILPLPPT